MNLLDQLLSIITPELFLADFSEKSTVTEKHGHLFCHLEGIGFCFCFAGGFVAENRASSAFRAGSVVDAVATALLSRGTVKDGESAFKDSCALLATRYRDMLPESWQDKAIQEEAGRDAYLRRRVYNKIVCTACDINTLPCQLIALADGGMEAAVRNLPGSVCILAKEEMKDLENRLQISGHTVNLPEAGCVIVPYFSQVHTVAGFDCFYHQGGKKKFSRFFWINPGRLSYFNLLSYNPGDRLFLSLLPGKAASLSSEMKARKERSTCLCVQMGTGDSSFFVPKSAFYIPEESSSHFQEPGELHTCGCEVTISTYTGGNETLLGKFSTSWAEYVVEAALLEFSEYKELTPKARMILASVKDDGFVRGAVRSRVLQLGLARLSRQLDSIFHEGLIFESNVCRIFATEEGYKFEDKRNADIGMEPISNFTLQMESLVAYSEEHHLYKGHIKMQGAQDIPLVLELGDLDSTKKLDAAVKRADMGACASRRKVPALYDLSLSRPLIPYLRRQSASLPIVQGISQLGWNGIKTVFTTPYSLNDGTSRQTDLILHPAISAFVHYQAKAYTPSSRAYKEIPESLLNIVKIAAAWIARTYVGHSVRPVFFINDSLSRKVFQTLFTATGQSSSIEINKNVRGKVSATGLYGYPHYAYGAFSPLLKSMESPVFILGDMGKALGEPLQDIQIEQTTRFFYDVLRDLPAHLIRTKGETYGRKCSVQYETSLIKEGEAILSEISTFVRKAPPYVNEYDDLEILLGSVTIEQASNLFCLDGDKITVPVSFLPDDSRERILSQIGCLVSRMEVKENTLLLDQVTGYSMLSSFYGKEFKLRPDAQVEAEFLALTGNV